MNHYEDDEFGFEQEPGMEVSQQQEPGMEVSQQQEPLPAQPSPAPAATAPSPTPSLTGVPQGPPPASFYGKAAQAPSSPAIGEPEQRGGPSRQLRQFASDWMSSPTRYTADVVKQAMEAVEAQMARVRQDQGNQLDAWLAHRGILASTPGAELTQDQIDRMGEQESREYLSILMDQARTYSQDMAAAGGMGLGVDTLSQRAVEHEDNVRLQSRALDLQKYGIDAQTSLGMARLQQDSQQFGVDAAIRNRALDLQQQGMGLDEAYRRARLEWDKSQDITRNEQWERSFGFEQAKEGTRQSEWEQPFGRDKQRWGEELDWDKQKWGEELDWGKQKWGEELDWKKQQWGEELGFKTKQWETDVANWAKEFGWKQDEAKRYWEWMYANKGVTPGNINQGGGGVGGGGGGHWGGDEVDEWGFPRDKDPY